MPDDLRIALNSFTASLEKCVAADDPRLRKTHAGRVGMHLLAVLAAYKALPKPYERSRPAREGDAWEE